MGEAVGCCAGGTTGMILGGLVYGGINAAFGAASGAIGAAVLESAGHTGYSTSEATQMGSAGSAIIGATTGALVGGVIGCLSGVGLFGNNNKGDDENKHPGNGLSQVVSYVGVQTLGGMLGWAMMQDANTVMDLGRTAAALATGSAITAIPASCLTICIALPLVMAGIACVAISNSDKASIAEDKEAARALTV